MFRIYTSYEQIDAPGEGETCHRPRCVPREVLEGRIPKAGRVEGFLSDASGQGAPEPDVSRLTIAEVLHVAHFSAHLARMVPSSQPELGQAWYQVVMSRWLKPAETPPWQRPDVDALVHALNGLQLMSWMQRPQVVRTWVAAAKQITPGPLDPVAADALRLRSLLLDSTMPPELARQYAEVDPD